MGDMKTIWNETRDEKPETVITGKYVRVQGDSYDHDYGFGDLYQYEVGGYLDEEADTYSWFDVFVDGECINLGQVLDDKPDALVYFIEWVANELKGEC